MKASWPGLSRPSTLYLIEKKDLIARDETRA
jgi:hypothetical protein